MIKDRRIEEMANRYNQKSLLLELRNAMTTLKLRALDVENKQQNEDHPIISAIADVFVKCAVLAEQMDKTDTLEREIDEATRKHFKKFAREKNREQRLRISSLQNSICAQCEFSATKRNTTATWKKECEGCAILAEIQESGEALLVDEKFPKRSNRGRKKKTEKDKATQE